MGVVESSRASRTDLKITCTSRTCSSYLTPESRVFENLADKGATDYYLSRLANLLAWSPNSRSIYALESARTSSQVLAVPLEGDSPRSVTRGEGVFRALSVSSAADQMAFTYEELEEPVEVYRSSVGRFEMKPLSKTNQDVPRPPMGRTEVVSWTSTGGFEIEGLLTYPIGYEAGKSYPLVLNVHGGPAGVYQQRFTGNPGIYVPLQERDHSHPGDSRRSRSEGPFYPRTGVLCGSIQARRSHRDDCLPQDAARPPRAQVLDGRDASHLGLVRKTLRGARPDRVVNRTAELNK